MRRRALVLFAALTLFLACCNPLISQACDGARCGRSVELHALELELENLLLALETGMSPPETILRCGPPAASTVLLKGVPPTGISGTVTQDAGGAPIANTIVNVRNGLGFAIAFGVTDGSGDYQVTGIEAGVYFVSTLTQTAFIIDEIYDDGPCPGGNCDVSIGDSVNVIDETITPSIDFALAPGGWVSGTVTEATTGDPLLNVDIDVFDDQGRFIDRGFSETDGTYSTFTGLPTGNYFAVAVNPSSLADELYDGIPCVDCDPTTGTPITVAAPNETPDIDFGLEIPILEDGFESGDVSKWSAVVPGS